MPLFEDNLSPYLTIVEATEPSAPAAGQQRIYIDSTTHKLKATNSSGTDRTIEGVAAGAITGSGLTMATARLLGRTTGSTGDVEEITVGSGLTLSAGSLTATGGSGISSGTSNPGSPTNGDLFYRSDLDLLIRYRSSGTRWVCTCLHTQPFMMQTSASLFPETVNGSFYTGLDTTSFDLFVERVALATFVPSGTNNGGNYWTLAVVNVSLGAGFDTQADGNTATRHDIAGGTIATGTKYAEITVTKTGSPAAVYVMSAGLIYRYIVT